MLVAFVDTGCLVGQDTQRRIFEPFFTTKGVRGYGMGLSVTYGIIERHGGDIQVSSHPGEGTRFALRLPALRSAAAAAAATEREEGPPLSSILVVYDEAAI